MSKTDFQNGFALGMATGSVVEIEIPAKEEQEKTITITENGTTEILPDENKALSKVIVVADVENGATLLDNTVTFTVDGEPYEIVSVKNGNSINAPVTSPISENGAFAGWQINGANVEFPYSPTEDVEINAKIQSVRNEITVTKAGTKISTACGTKVNDGLAVLGWFYYTGTGQYKALVIGKSEADIQVQDNSGTNYTLQNITYNGEVWYFRAYAINYSSGCTDGDTTPYRIPNTTTVNSHEEGARLILDYYFSKS